MPKIFSRVSASASYTGLVRHKYTHEGSDVVRVGIVLVVRVDLVDRTSVDRVLTS